MQYKPRLEYEHRFTFRFGSPFYVYFVVGAHGAIHFWVTDHGEEYSQKYDVERYSGGLEIHYRHPPDYMAGDAPSQERCWLLNAPCWHDGTSLYASESLIPRWLIDQSHDAIKRMLEREYEQQFGEHGWSPSTIPLIRTRATRWGCKSLKLC